MAGFLALDELFEGRHFDREVIVLCVRWYFAVQTQLPRSGGDDGGARRFPWFTPPSCAGCTTTHRSSVRRWNRFARTAGPSWRVDETYVKIRGKWMASLYPGGGWRR